MPLLVSPSPRNPVLLNFFSTSTTLPWHLNWSTIKLWFNARISNSFTFTYRTSRPGQFSSNDSIQELGTSLHSLTELHILGSFRIFQILVGFQILFALYHDRWHYENWERISDHCCNPNAVLNLSCYNTKGTKSELLKRR